MRFEVARSGGPTSAHSCAVTRTGTTPVTPFTGRRTLERSLGTVKQRGGCVQGVGTRVEGAQPFAGRLRFR